MAVPPIDVRATWSGDELSTGALGAKADLEALGTAADGVATDINTSLSSVSTTATTEFGAVGTAADNSAVDLTTKASKFKAVGTELGTELAQGVSSGVDPATSAVNVGSSLSGLLAASAGTALGAAAAVGLGLGVALIKNMVDGAKESQEKFTATVDEIFNDVEVTARKSLDRIRQDIFEAFTVKEAVDQLKDLGISVTQVEALTKGLNVPFSEIVEILRGDINPANKDTLEILRQQKDQMRDLLGTHGGIAETLTDEQKLAGRILGLADDRARANEEAFGWASLEKDALVGTAEAAEIAAAAAERLGSALGNAARQASTIALDLGS